MNEIATFSAESLPSLIDRASHALSNARTAGEVLEARDFARVAYDAAKSAGRMARAKKAHDDVMGAVYRAQADALLIEARAKHRLADEYDAAQDRGEVATGREGKGLGVARDNAQIATAADLGLRRDEIHNARQFRDAELASPGLAQQALDSMVEARVEPTRAALQASVRAALAERQREPSNANPVKVRDPLRDAVTVFAGTCREIAEAKNIEAMARWRGHGWTAQNAREQAQAAVAALQNFIQMHEEHDA